MPRDCLVRLVGWLSGCLLGLNACATQVLHHANALAPDATPAQVRAVLGEPHERQFRGNQEAWQYCETGLLQDTFVIVWFAESKVTGLSTYHNAVGVEGFSVIAICVPSRGTKPHRHGRNDKRATIIAYVSAGIFDANTCICWVGERPDSCSHGWPWLAPKPTAAVKCALSTRGSIA
jgi:hypothetical protein